MQMKNDNEENVQSEEVKENQGDSRTSEELNGMEPQKQQEDVTSSQGENENNANAEELERIRIQNRKLKSLAVGIISVLAGVVIGVGAILVDKTMLEPIRKEKDLEEARRLEASVAGEMPEANLDYQVEQGSEESSVVSSEAEVVEETTYTVIAPITNTYIYENDASDVAEALSGGTQITVIGKNGDYYEYKMKDGRTGYIYDGDVVEGVLYASYEGATDLRSVLPDSEFEILFATDQNVTHHGLYPAIPLLESGTAELIREAEKKFEADGYRIKIYDAYRPKWAQYELYDAVQDNRYIANPYNGNSWHQLGRAVDMSLTRIDTGEELEMPTPMHTFSSMAQRNNSNWSEEAKKNVDYMTEVMASVGMTTIQTEWWHFENKASGNYMPNQIDYTQITYVPAEQY